MPQSLRRSVDEMRLAATSQLSPNRRADFGQFMTPSAIADFMSSRFERWPAEIRLLDPGAGVGSLTEAFARQWAIKSPRNSRLTVTAYEIDPVLIKFLKSHLGGLAAEAWGWKRDLRYSVIPRDFIVEGSFSASFKGPRYSHVILNPPYRKIATASDHRRLLSRAGIETVNLYTAFLALSVELCEPGGEIVGIVPRSFCNGTYFRPFREWLLERACIKHIHVFGSRQKAFQDDDVLQENIIIHLSRDTPQRSPLVSTSTDATFRDLRQLKLPFAKIVKPSDPERFIHIPASRSTTEPTLFRYSLAELGLGVATGPVVDFRVRDHWLAAPTPESVPLIYAHHFRSRFEWPREHRKPNALSLNEETRKWLLPRGWYAVAKRFSSKEEKRRIVAYVVDPRNLPGELYGFENHLNIIHRAKKGLTEEVARGIAVFLNSTIVDQHFRTFSGHTQVNATDLRSMKFPEIADLVRFGEWAKRRGSLSQAAIDEFVEAQDSIASDPDHLIHFNGARFLSPYPHRS